VAVVVMGSGGGVELPFGVPVEACSELAQALKAAAATSATLTIVTLPAMRMDVTLGNRVTHWFHRVPGR
jgi:hypothetical protein